MEKKKSPSLGKGLGALLGDDTQILSPQSIVRLKSDTNSYININAIETNPAQPRSQFEQEKIEELAESIMAYGLIQPITVRPVDNGKYQLISGERRLKACKIVGLKEIPAFVRTVDEILSIQMALVENIQRENLNAIEIAVSYQRLIDECNLTQEELSAKIGKDRSTISNYLRLLKLSKDAQIAIRDNKISMGHARAIISITDEAAQIKIVNSIIQQELSVRQTEALVNKANVEKTNNKNKINILFPNDIVEQKNKLEQKLHYKINIKKDTKGKGKITIPFSSDENLKNILIQLNL